MAVEIREMLSADYDDAVSLWQESQGVSLSGTDSREGIAAFLARNPGLSLVAHSEGLLIGAVLCGHDGRRGYLHHLAVARGSRGQGIGRRLVEVCLAKLAAAGLQKCYIFLRADNAEGQGFWRGIGLEERTDLTVMSRGITPSPGPPSA
jgi:putative acetyltransferase